MKNILRTFLTFSLITFVFLFFSIDSKAAGTGAVSITSATISGGEVVVIAAASDLPDSDDGIYYLYAEKTYQDNPTGNVVATAPVGPDAVFVFPLNYGTTACHLYEKFQVAVLQGGAVVPLCAAKYISNPEALAHVSLPKKNNGKKGLILDGAKIGNGNTEVLTLGVQQGAYNINLEDVIGGNRVIPYNYNGKTYYFDSSYMSQYDHCVRITSSQGIGLTMVLLNPYAAGEEYMISPYARGGIGKSKSSYYLMNTSEDAGLEALEAVVSYLANRYDGQHGVGQVDNWVIANEVNAKDYWNYAGAMDVATYARLYADSLRVCYMAIRSQNANATVCLSLDNEWTSVAGGANYTARTTLEHINAYVKAQGDFDWALAFHPYNYPMAWTNFWSPKSAKTAAMIRHSIDSPYISMENIEQLTDYMSLEFMRGTRGQVRDILLTEIGYSSNQGEANQAAAMIYAYHRTVTNQYLDMIVFNRQTDFPVEVRNGLSVGLSYQNGARKQSFDAFANMNGANAENYKNFAANFAGIADWNAAMYAR
ncbi:MAG: hypothetical protein K6F75_01440 [Butyrivibrio sp.]|nr:hypothetical protein [Butyrivibrio sp.]